MQTATKPAIQPNFRDRPEGLELVLHTQVSLTLALTPALSPFGERETVAVREG